MTINETCDYSNKYIHALQWLFYIENTTPLFPDR